MSSSQKEIIRQITSQQCQSEQSKALLQSQHNENKKSFQNPTLIKTIIGLNTAFFVAIGMIVAAIVTVTFKLIWKFILFIGNNLQSLGKKLHYGKNRRRKIRYLIKSFNVTQITKSIQDLEEDIPKYFTQNLKIRKKSLPYSPNRYLSQKQIRKRLENPQEYLQHTSNQVLCNIKQSNNKCTITYYVPTYLRLLLKNFTSIDLSKLEAEVNANIIITFVYGNKGMIRLPEEVANRLNNEVVLNFERDQPLRLTTEDSEYISVKQDEHNSIITFTVRRKFKLKIQSDVKFTPFQELDLMLPITIQQITAATIQSPEDFIKKEVLEKQFKGKTIQAGIKFNFMDNQTPFVKMDFKDQSSFGNYSIIQSQLQTKYSNNKIPSKQQKQKKLKESKKQEKKIKKQGSRLKRLTDLLPKERDPELIQLMQKQINDLQNKKQKRNKIDKQKESRRQEKKKDPDNFQYSHFKIPIYKHPFASLMMIFLPLWSLTMINLGIFFQEESLSQRIASIGGVMIAYIAFIPSIRDQIPPNPQVVFVQYLVYLQIFASLLCLLDSINVRNEINHEMIWSENNYFLFALAIFLSEIVIITSMLLYHYLVCVPQYNLDEDQMQWKKDKNKTKFNHFTWQNKDCDKAFEQIIKQSNDNKKKFNVTWIGKVTDLPDRFKYLKELNRNEKAGEIKQIVNKAARDVLNINSEKFMGKEEHEEEQSPLKSSNQFWHQPSSYQPSHQQPLKSSHQFWHQPSSYQPSHQQPVKSLHQSSTLITNENNFEALESFLKMTSSLSLEKIVSPQQ